MSEAPSLRWTPLIVVVTICVGLFVGGFGSFLGIGGGVLFVPALIYIYRIKPHDATVTSLGVIFFLSLASATADTLEGTAQLSVAGFVTVGAVVGAYGVGVPLAARVSPEVLKRLFGGLLALVALKLILAPEFGQGLLTPNPIVALAGGLLAGATAGFFGVGGGIIMVPLLTIVYGLTQHQAHATSMCIMVLAVLAGIVKAHISRDRTIHWRMVAALAPSAVVGALLGVELRAVFSPDQLRSIFAWVLLILSLRMAGLLETIRRRPRHRIGNQQP